MRVRTILLAFLCFTAALFATAQTAANADEQAIRNVMAKSAADWNRGDLDAFASSYKNAPDTLFVSSSVSRGYDGMLATYKRSYGTPESRGKLSFSNLEVHLLDANFATAVGNCHLDRTPAGGGPYDCIYSLVFQKTPAGWKIILDHSSALPAKH